MLSQSPKVRLIFYCVTLAFLLAASPSVFAQTYKNPRLIPTGSRPSTLSAGDFNHDGKQDIVYVDPSGLHILLGNGDGSFQHGQDIQLPQGIGGTITIADVNKDGVLDLVLGGGGPMAQIGVFLGNGDGTFGAIHLTQFAPMGNLFAVLGARIGVADVNEDGAVDLIASDIQNNAMYILFGNNTGSFTLHSSFTHFTNPGTVFTADFNGDHHVDFIVANRSSEDVTVFLGNGDGSFQPGVSYAGPNHLGSIVLADMDGDGHVDIVGTTQIGSIVILQGNADGTFNNASFGGVANAGPSPILFDVTDLNSDGFQDLLTISLNGLCVLKGKAALAFNAPQCFVTAPNNPVALLTDFNGDGHKDVVTTSSEGISLLIGNADGTFQSADSYDTGQLIQSVAVADFNQDHSADIAAAALTGPPQILLGNGTGKFTLSTNLSPVTGAIPPEVQIGDFDGDGKPDLLFGGINSLVAVLFGNGDGTFTAPVSSSFSITGFGHSAVADFNRDGRSDVVTTDISSYHVILGQSNRTLPSTNVIPVGGVNAFNPPVAGDFTNDGIPDFAVSELGGVQIFIGNGDGTFKAGHLINMTIPGLAQNSGPIAIGDFDGDGKLDIVSAQGPTPGFEILYGNGDGTFQDPVFFQLSTRFSQIVVADLDNDGKPDLVFSDGSFIATVHNTGARTFGPEQHYLAGNVGQFVVKDVNGDGLPDIIVANGAGPDATGTSVTVLLSQNNVGQTTGHTSVSPEPSFFSQPFTMNLSLAAVNSSTGIPTGSVRFSVDGVPILSSVLLNAGAASFTYPDAPPLPVGIHTVTANYSGDSAFTTAEFVVNHTIVSENIPTSTGLTATLTTIVASQTVHFVATTTSSVLAPMPLAKVAFHDGSTNLGVSQADVNGVAVFDTSLLAAGTHSITAVFLGVTNFDGSLTYTPSLSSPVSIIVGASATTSLLTALQNPIPSGAMTSLRTVVSSAGGTPTGAVTFFDGRSALATQPLDSAGTATYSASFSGPATHTIAATYAANASFASSTSLPLNLTVTAAPSNPTTTVLTIGAGALQAGGALNLSVAVNARSGNPSGIAYFLDGSVIVGQAILDSHGSATFTGETLTAGVHYLTASFPGNAAFGPSVSPAHMLDTSKAADFAINASPASSSVTSGQSTAILVTVNAVNGFNGDVVLNCVTGVPGVSCSAIPAQIHASGTSHLSISSFAGEFSVSRVAPSSFPKTIGAALLVLGAGSLAILLFARKKRLAFATVCLGCLVVTAGCGSSSSPPSGSVPSGLITVTINAASTRQSVTTSHSVQVQLTLTSNK